MTYDNHEEVIKIARHAPQRGPRAAAASAQHGLDGRAVEQVRGASRAKRWISSPSRTTTSSKSKGLSFHVGSQCTNVQNYVQALHLASSVFAEARTRGFELKLLDIGGGFPAHYDDSVPAFKKLAAAINPELDRLFPQAGRDSRRA